MSRSATALAFDLQIDEQVDPRCQIDVDYRLLGSSRQHHIRRPARAEPLPLRRPIRSIPYLGAIEDAEPSAHFHEELGHRASVRVAHPQWLLGTLLALSALAAVVSPVLAARQRRDDSPISALSGYVGSSQTTDGSAPVIDTTTRSDSAGQEAPPPQEPPGAESYALTAVPSLSVAQIESVLSQYGSPAVGKGQSLFDLGVRYGLDPAYALAFFVHESGCGTKGVARFTKSLGNIRWTAGYNNYEGYRSYDSWEQGFEDWYRLITELYVDGWNLRTVDEIIPVYAPWGDNNHPPTYIASVKAMVDGWRGK